jgi:ureidoglycolate lyase
MSATGTVVRPRPLTAAEFSRFGQVFGDDWSGGAPANDGTARRFDDVAALELTSHGGRPQLSLFRATPLALPLTVRVLERHPLSSQAFIPLSPRPFLVVVAPPGETVASEDVFAFVTAPGQGVNYGPGVWHHALVALGAVSDFAVVGRAGTDDNCDFFRLDRPVLVAAEEAAAPGGVDR